MDRKFFASLGLCRSYDVANQSMLSFLETRKFSKNEVEKSVGQCKKKNEVGKSVVQCKKKSTSVFGTSLSLLLTNKCT